MDNTKYINGSDILLKVGGKAIGHCTTHSVTFNTDSKERAVKPLASLNSTTVGLWKEKGITGLSINISAEGLRVINETENGYDELAPKWGKGDVVEVECFKRGDAANPYIKGDFVITSMEETSPAQDDTTYSIQLENNGEPDIYPGKDTTGE